MIVTDQVKEAVDKIMNDNQCKDTTFLVGEKLVLIIQMVLLELQYKAASSQFNVTDFIEVGDVYNKEQIIEFVLQVLQMNQQ